MVAPNHRPTTHAFTHPITHYPLTRLLTLYHSPSTTTHIYPHTGGCGGNLSTAEYVVSLVTVPIPVMLNLFWFWKIVSKAKRMLYPKPKKDDAKAK